MSILTRKEMDHTAVSATQASSVTLKSHKNTVLYSHYNDYCWCWNLLNTHVGIQKLVRSIFYLNFVSTSIMLNCRSVRAMNTPQTPLLYSKTGVCRGIPNFLIFAPKQARRFSRVPTIYMYVLSKNKKNIKHFLLKFFIF